MTSDLFYELYRKLAAARSEPTKGLPVLDELAEVCRDRKEAVSSSDDSPFKSVEKANEALMILEEQEGWLEGLPRLNEFAMPPAMLLTLSSLKRSEERAIHRRSSETSIVSQLFTTQHFKYANKTAVEFVVGDQIQETTLEMSPYSVSVELPISERTDPESGIARWRGLW